MLRIWGLRKKQCNELEKGKHSIPNVESTLRTTDINPRYTEGPVANISINTTLHSGDGQIPGSSTATKFVIPHTNSLPARTLVVYSRPPLARRVRPTAMDFHSEGDESIGPEEYLRLNEPIASSRKEKQYSVVCDGLYKSPAQAAASGSMNDDVIMESTATTAQTEELGCGTHEQTEGQEQQGVGESSLTLSSQKSGQHQHSWQQDIGASKSSSSHRHSQQQVAEAGFSSLFPNQQHRKRQKWQQQGSGVAFPPNQWYRHQKPQHVTGTSSSRLSTDQYWWQGNPRQRDTRVGFSVSPLWQQYWHQQTMEGQYWKKQ